MTAVVAAVLAAGVLFGMSALVVDLGLARDLRQGSQISSDAASLAAANALYPASGTCTSGGASPCVTDAVTAAKTIARIDFGVQPTDWTGCSDSSTLTYRPDAANTCISFDSGTAPTRVRVTMPTRNAPARFSGGADSTVRSVPITSAAQAGVAPGKAVTCGLCFLGSVDSGNADYTITGGGIAVSGDVSMNATGNMVSSSNAVSGTASGGRFAPAATKIAPFSDPWASRTDLPPSATSPTILTTKSDPCSTGSAGGPGIYGSFAFPKSTCTLRAGLYVVTGAWTESNNSVIAGTGVTLYFTCKATSGSAPRACAGAPAGEGGGYLDAKNGDVAIAAPTSAPVANAVVGVAIMYDRNNNANLGLQGNGGTSITGSVYVPNSSLDFNGGSCFGFDKGVVIAESVVKANGTKSCVTITNPVGTKVQDLPGAVVLDR